MLSQILKCSTCHCHKMLYFHNVKSWSIWQ